MSYADIGVGTGELGNHLARVSFREASARIRNPFRTNPNEIEQCCLQGTVLERATQRKQNKRTAYKRS